jgi:hypothetical protein
MAKCIPEKFVGVKMVVAIQQKFIEKEENLIFIPKIYNRQYFQFLQEFWITKIPIQYFKMYSPKRAERLVFMKKLKFDMDVLVNYMDDEIREKLHNEIAPCTDEEFVAKYEELHKEKFDEKFTIDGMNIWEEIKYIVSITDETHELRIYNYEYESLGEAEKHYGIEKYNALLIEVENDIETIIKSK